MMKQYVKENSSGEQMTLMGNVKCYINMLEFGVCVCVSCVVFFFRYEGQQSTPSSRFLNKYVFSLQKKGGRGGEMLAED